MDLIYIHIYDYDEISIMPRYGLLIYISIDMHVPRKLYYELYAATCSPLLRGIRMNFQILKLTRNPYAATCLTIYAAACMPKF